ncbi:MAG: filamentation induced by cAMP protein Fic [Conexibacter sp.]|nr:filamentation induced by cAMP protein Fic [Conexibacter sp.]
MVIGARGRPLPDARFVPPPPGDQLRAGVEALLDWVFSPPGLPTVVQAAMTHYQFETLYPFAAAAESQANVERLVALQAELRARVQHANKRGAAERLAADLVGGPYVTVSVVARLYGLSVPGATKIIRTLVDLEILMPASFSGPRGAQMFGAPDVLRVLDA